MDEAVRVWSYVLAKDVGIAPCIDDGILTLCTCKPRIRAGARVGDWVLSTLPKRFGVGRVAWVGRVAEVIETGACTDRWPGRVDALYERKPDGTLSHRGGAYHAEPDLIARDLSVRRCLRFDPFWYFGGEGPILPERLVDLCHYYVGQSTRDVRGKTRRDLEQWLAAWPPGVHGAPREAAEGARWRASMPYLHRTGPLLADPSDTRAPNGPGEVSVGRGCAPPLRRPAPRPRSC